MITYSRRNNSPVPTLRHKEPCHHDWQTYKESIKVDNPHYDHTKQPYFIVRACPKCRTKRVIDYRVD